MGVKRQTTPGGRVRLEPFVRNVQAQQRRGHHPLVALDRTEPNNVQYRVLAFGGVRNLVSTRLARLEHASERLPEQVLVQPEHKVVAVRATNSVDIQPANGAVALEHRTVARHRHQQAGGVLHQVTQALLGNQ